MKPYCEESEDEFDVDEPAECDGDFAPTTGNVTAGNRLKRQNNRGKSDMEEEAEETDESEEEPADEDGRQTTPKEFSSGAFVVKKTDLQKSENLPIWKIDGKSLLQKYEPFDRDGKTLYKSTSTYSSWHINKKDQYYPAVVIIKQHTRKEHVVEFRRDLIK